MSSPGTGIELDIKINQQSLQMYTRDNLNGTNLAKAGQQHANGMTTYKQYWRIVIEAQQWIDGTNNPQWDQSQVTDEPAVHLATYNFSVSVGSYS